MKIGILTYIYAVNHGSILQAKAVEGVMKSVYPDADIRFINYAPYRGLYKEIKNNLINRRFISGYLVLNKFRKVISKEMPFWGKLTVTDSYAEASKYVSELDLDLICIGSDTVFESRPNKLGYAPFPPNIFFGNSALDSKFISISASADRSFKKYWSSEALETVKENLAAFDYISVRDNFTGEFLSDAFDISSSSITVLPDPTFSFEPPEVFVDLESSFGLKRRGYVVLDVSNRMLSKAVYNFFREKNILVISPMSNRHSDVNLRGKIDPYQWASLYANSYFNVTNRFHGTVFSIKGGAEFVAVDESPEYALGAKSKKMDLLASVDESQRLYELHSDSEAECIARIISFLGGARENTEAVLQSKANGKRLIWEAEIENIRAAI